MPVAKAAIDRSSLPDMQALLAEQKVLAGTLKTARGESDPLTKARALRKKLAELKATEDTLRAKVARDETLKADLNVRIGTARADLIGLENDLALEEDSLLLLDAEIRELQRSFDTANMSRLDLEAAYPALASPVPHLSDEIETWIAEFQGVTPDPRVSRSIHKTYFLAVSKVQAEGPRLTGLQANRADLADSCDKRRQKRTTDQQAADKMIAEERALEMSVSEDQMAADAAAGAAEGTAAKLIPVAAASMSVKDAQSVIDGMNRMLAAASGVLSAKAADLIKACKSIDAVSPIADTGQTRESFDTRLTVCQSEADFITKSVTRGDTSFGISRISDLIDRLDQDVDSVNITLRSKLSEDRKPLLVAAARLRAEAIASEAREGDPVPVAELLIDEATLDGLELGLDEGAEISTLTSQLDAEINRKLADILDARISAAKAEKRRLRDEAREIQVQGIRVLAEAVAFAAVPEFRRRQIVREQAGLAASGKATIASATALLTEALRKQHHPETATWRTALGITDKQFPDTGKKFGGFRIHVSFFPKENLSRQAAGQLSLVTSTGGPADAADLMEKLFTRREVGARVHATLETGAAETPKVYYPGDADDEYWNFTDLGGDTELRTALHAYLNATIKPKIQKFIDSHGLGTR